MLSDVSAVKAAASELVALSDEQGLLQARASALMFLGWALARSGNVEQEVAHLEQGLCALKNRSPRPRYPLSLFHGRGLLIGPVDRDEMRAGR